MYTVSSIYKGLYNVNIICHAHIMMRQSAVNKIVPNLKVDIDNSFIDYQLTKH